MKHFMNILCLIDSLAPDSTTLARAVSVAKSHGARLTVADVVAADYPHVAASVGIDPAKWHDATIGRRRRELQALLQPHRELPAIDARILVGTAFIEIIREVLAQGHDLVIKSAERPPLLKRLFGSGDMHLLRKCPCPVWLTRPAAGTRYERILAAVDLPTDLQDRVAEDLSEDILDLATGIAHGDGARLDIVHAWEAPAESTLRTWGDDPDTVHRYVDAERRQHQLALDSLRRQFIERMGAQRLARITPAFHLERGPAALAIPAAAARMQADLVVMGTVARVGIAGLLIGNTAESILEQLDCDVLAVKPPGFETLVRPR